MRERIRINWRRRRRGYCRRHRAGKVRVEAGEVGHYDVVESRRMPVGPPPTTVEGLGGLLTLVLLGKMDVVG